METFEYNGRTREKKAHAMNVSGTAYFTQILAPSKEGKLRGKRISPAYSICLVPDEEFWPYIEGMEIVVKDGNDNIPGRYIQPYVSTDKIEQAEAAGKRGPRKPLLLDAENRPLDKLVGNGSKVDVTFFGVPEQRGILNAVRVQELVEYEGGQSDPNDLSNVVYRLTQEEQEASTDEPEVRISEEEADSIQPLNDGIPF
ncbi:MAG: hypothetical protein HRT61_01095 [Ekhidna sp.]|nr:hypothetical protein [Ekhidna sp.]